MKDERRKFEFSFQWSVFRRDAIILQRASSHELRAFLKINRALYILYITMYGRKAFRPFYLLNFINITNSIKLYRRKALRLCTTTNSEQWKK